MLQPFGVKCTKLFLNSACSRSMSFCWLSVSTSGSRFGPLVMHRFTRPYGIAVAYCERNKGAKLIVATLSRLTRDTQTPAPKVGTEGLGQLANE